MPSLSSSLALSALALAAYASASDPIVADTVGDIPTHDIPPDNNIPVSDTPIDDTPVDEWGILEAYAGMIVLAMIPIYVGSLFALHNSEAPAETMSANDAWRFPLIGSCVLFGLYVLFSVFNKDYINMLLSAYFLLLGVLALTASLSRLTTKFWESDTYFKFDLPKVLSYVLGEDPKKKEGEYDVEFSPPHIVAFVASLGIVIYYAMTKNWIANNVLGLSFATQGVELLALDSFKVGAILLSGLFFYDIFWVFGTEVMVTVAKSVDHPIKLLFPKDGLLNATKFSMLGLGDIVIPGIVIAFLLRYDAHRAGLDRSTRGGKPFPRTFFHTTLFAYFVGLVTTICVMHFFQAAQPALLYLVPTCLGAPLTLALCKGCLKDLFAYTEATEEDEDKDKKDEKEKEPKKER